jgi:dolichol kinase
MSILRIYSYGVKKMDDCELIALITGIACTISKCYSTDEISLMAVVFTQLGDTLSTILLQRELKSNNQSSDKASVKKVKDSSEEE